MISFSRTTDGPGVATIDVPSISMLAAAVEFGFAASTVVETKHREIQEESVILAYFVPEWPFVTLFEDCNWDNLCKASSRSRIMRAIIR
jgi:hypothetical protein